MGADEGCFREYDFCECKPGMAHVLREGFG
jgi:hypothetical protein